MRLGRAMHHFCSSLMLDFQVYTVRIYTYTLRYGTLLCISPMVMMMMMMMMMSIMMMINVVIMIILNIFVSNIIIMIGFFHTAGTSLRQSLI